MGRPLHTSRRKGVALATLQQVERVFGTLTCALLHTPAKLIPGARSMDPDKVKKVLVVKFFGIGSLVLATPFFREARSLFPNAEIHLLTLSSNREITKMIPELDRVHHVSLGSNIFSAVVAYITCLFQTFSQRYDVLIDMEFYTRASAVLSVASWAPVRIGYHSRGVYRGDIHNFKIPFNSYFHVTKNFLSLLEPYHYEPQDTIQAPQIAVAKELQGPAIKALSNIEALSLSKFIVINVNAGELAYERRWMIDRFVQLTVQLGQVYDLTCVFIGSQHDRAYTQQAVDGVLAKGEKALNVAGELDLVSLAQLFQKSSLVLSNDSGPLHIAAAVGARVVGFYGPETPILYGPVGEDNIALCATLSCSPCINIEQGKHLKCWHETLLCQEGISVDYAYEEIKKNYDDVLSSP